MRKVVYSVIFAVILLGMVVFLLLPDEKLIPQKTSQTDSESNLIKDALVKSTSLMCDYTDEEGRKAKTYIKNGAVRSDYVAQKAGDSGSTIIKNKKMYVWTAKKEGFVIDLSETVAAEETEADAIYKMISGLEKNQQYCKSADVSDDIFTPPSDVKFEDYTQVAEEQEPTTKK